MITNTKMNNINRKNTLYNKISNYILEYYKKKKSLLKNKNFPNGSENMYLKNFGRKY
jgi:hypothetical protein